VMKKFDRAGRWPVNKASRSVNPPGMSEQGYKIVRSRCMLTESAGSQE
jgi:hypothetical protein